MRGRIVIGLVVALVLACASAASASLVPVGSSATAYPPAGGDNKMTLGSYTVPQGVHRLLVVSIATGGNAASATGVTFNGKALTRNAIAAAASNTGSEIWSVRLGTATGAETGSIVASFSNNVLGSMTAVSFRGADQTAAYAAANSANATVTLPTNFGHYLIDVISVTGGNTGVAPGTNQTLQGALNDGTYQQWSGVSTKPGSSVNGAGHNVQMTWTHSQNALGIAHSGINIVPAPDNDDDGVLNTADNCPNTSNANQFNHDQDNLGDACDPDDDSDGVADATDNCDFLASPDQNDNDDDGAGDPCDANDDTDQVADVDDNCSLVANQDQNNNDADAAGDACDSDDDNDQVADADDNCDLVANPDQPDNEADGEGDACDADDDNDERVDGADNCPLLGNPVQENADADTQGDACDADDDNDQVLDADDAFPLDPSRSATPPPPTPLPPAPPAPVAQLTPTTPVVSAVRLRSARFRRAIGTRLTFSLNTAATLRIVAKGTARGRRARGRCVATARRGTRCTLRHAAVTRRVAGALGANTVAFGRGLKRGSYRATIIATDAGGRASQPVRIRFTVR